MKKQAEDIVDIMNGAETKTTQVDNEESTKVVEISEPEKSVTPDETVVPENPVKVEEPKQVDTTGEAPHQKRGMVFNCLALRVRKEAAFDCDVLDTINKGTSVVIDESKSTEAFYSVVTRAGITGFCSKQFIKLL